MQTETGRKAAPALIVRCTRIKQETDRELFDYGFLKWPYWLPLFAWSLPLCALSLPLIFAAYPDRGRVTAATIGATHATLSNERFEGEPGASLFLTSSSMLVTP